MYWDKTDPFAGIFSTTVEKEQKKPVKEQAVDVEVFKLTQNPRILRVFGPWLCYEVVSESREPVERFQSFSDAEKYLELLIKYEAVNKSKV